MVLGLALLEASSLFAVCSMILFWAQPNPFDDIPGALIQALAMSLCCVISFYYNDLYDLRIVRSLADFAPRLLQSLLVAFILLAAFYIFFPRVRVPGALFLPVLLTIAGLLLLVRAVCYRAIKGPFLSHRVLILGTSPLALRIADEIRAAPYLRYTVLGFLGDQDNGGRPAQGALYPVLGPLETAEVVIKELQPDRLIVALAERRGRLPVWSLLSSCFRELMVEDAVEFYESITRKLAIESLNPSFLLFSKDFRKTKFQLALRRVVNLALSAIGLILTAALMAIIALLIKLDSKGPVFFIQERAGLGGRNFKLIKFRTMKNSSPTQPESVWAREIESRVTRAGKWLRKLRLDELPQFINILLGDMDLIGPRPEMVCNVKTMEQQIPYYSLRHLVRPGVTGWAQVRHGYSVSLTDVTEKIRYDLYYIKHMSFWFDLHILVDTVKIVLFGRGK